LPVDFVSAVCTLSQLKCIQLEACHLPIGVNGDPTAHPSARFLRQVVEPLSRFSNVVVAGPLFRLVDAVAVPPPVLAKKVKTTLVLELSADDDLSALLLQR